MQGELVSTMTPDQVRLHGFYVRPMSAASRPAPIAFDASVTETAESELQMSAPTLAWLHEPLENRPAVILLHGLAGNFYSSPLLLQLGRRFHEAGLGVLLGNTRGHDYLNATVRVGRTRTLGAAVELVSEGVEDVAGWVRFLQNQGHQRIVLVGHSLGAIKSLYSQAHRPQATVIGVVALSPTRLNFEQFVASRQREKFLHTIERAEQALAAGRGEELMAIEFPFPTWMTADAYLNKYGCNNHYDWIPIIDRIQQPTLITFGRLELDDNAAFEGLAASLQHLVDQNQINWLAGHELSPAAATGQDAKPNRPPLGRRQLAIIPRADHFYVAAYDRTADLVLPWLANYLRPESGGSSVIETT